MCVCVFLLGQNKTLEEYPAQMSLTSLVCLMGVVEGGIVAVIMERRKSAWAIGFDSRLLAAAYTVSGSGPRFSSS